MNVVIPMAGHSKRFAKKGYTTPKPFIDIDGKPMIAHVVSMFSEKDTFYFLCNETHLPTYQPIFDTLHVKHHIIPTPPHEDGPVQTTLFHETLLPDDSPLIITYCDFLQQWHYTRFLQSAMQSDGCIAAFKGFQPASFGSTNYCYLKTKNMQLLELQEKKPYTNERWREYASTGVYYFKSWGDYLYFAKQLVRETKQVGSEYYVSLLFNLMVEKKQDIQVFEVEKFICLGTPEDLEEYRFWSTYFNAPCA